ncbi:MAG: hypothetical protein ACJ8NS_09455 [Chthoniobacterales bacterium]
MRAAFISVFVALNSVIATEPSELVFRGTIIRIEQGVTADPFKSFVITTSVDKVLSGSFHGKQFQFAVHSPSQSGLGTGKQYTVRVTRTETGYTVDELQWVRATEHKKQ